MDKRADETLIHLDDPALPVALHRRRGSRRLTLRVDPVTGDARVTAPPEAPLRDIRLFLLRQSDWLKRARSRVPEPVHVTDGTEIPVLGKPYQIRRVPGPARVAKLTGGLLTIGGDRPAGPMVAAWLKLRARDELLPRVRGYAEKLDRTVLGIALRDTRSRWGSCSSAGRLSFSWRLAMAPVDVLDYVAAHEAAHLVEMNHSARYWAVVERLMPDYAPRRNWLKREGRSLHRFIFEV